MCYDPLGHLATIKEVKRREMAEAKPSGPVLLICQLFEAQAEREARNYQKLRDYKAPAETD